MYYGCIGGYTIGQNYYHKAYLRSPEIIDKMLQILRKESARKSHALAKFEEKLAQEKQKTQRKKRKYERKIVALRLKHRVSVHFKKK